MFLFDKPATELENKLGYAPGTLAAGWSLLSPSMPIAPSNIDLRGSTRWPEGKMPNGKEINSIIASRLDVPAAQKKLATFFDRGLDRRPAKVLPKLDPIAYPPARPIGIPQFKLRNPVNWVVLADVKPGDVLRRGDVKF